MCRVAETRLLSNKPVQIENPAPEPRGTGDAQQPIRVQRGEPSCYAAYRSLMKATLTTGINLSFTLEWLVATEKSSVILKMSRSVGRAAASFNSGETIAHFPFLVL